MVPVLNIALGAIGGREVVNQLTEIANVAVDVAVKTDRMNMMLKTSSDTLQVGDKMISTYATNMQFVKDISNKMGTEIFSTAESFAKLSAATKDTRLQGEETQKMFATFAEANARLGGSAYDLTGMLNALTQMSSKGKVSMEELRQQLGDRLPGTMKLAAESMGMTTAELNKQITDGKLYAEDFLPKFTEAVKKAFGKEGPIDSAQANLNRLTNAFTELKQLLTDSGWVNSAIEGVTNVINRTTWMFSDKLDDQIKNAQARIKDFNEGGAFARTYQYAINWGFDVNEEQAKLDKLLEQKKKIDDEQKKILDSQEKKAKDAPTQKGPDQGELDKAAKAAERMAERYRDFVGSTENSINTIYANTTSNRIEQIKRMGDAEYERLENQLRNAHLTGNLLIQAEEELGKAKIVINEHTEAQIREEQIKTEKAYNKIIDSSEMKVAQSEYNKLKQIQLTEKAAIQEINDRYDTEMKNANYTAQQIIQLEQSKARELEIVQRRSTQEQTRITGTFTDKVKLNFKDMTDKNGSDWDQFTSFAADKFTGMADGISSSLVDMAMSGKATFKDFAMSIIADIEKMILKMLIMKALQEAIGMFGFGGNVSGDATGAGLGTAQTVEPASSFSGSFFSASGNQFDGPVTAYATGAIIDTPRAFSTKSGTGLMGESATPEAIVPLVRGYDNKIGIASYGSQSSGINIGSIQVNVKADEKTNPDQQGAIIGKAIRDQLVSLMDQRIAFSRNPGGIMNPTQLSAF